MKVILNEDIANLGEEGDIKIVANGYARNYLIPQKKALAYNKNNIHNLKLKEEIIKKKKEDKRKQALSLKDRLANEVLTVDMHAGNNGRLFGAVTANILLEHLEKLGIHLERRSIDISNHSIKKVGQYKINVKLYGGENSFFTVDVRGLDQAGNLLEIIEEGSTPKEEINTEESND